MREKISHKDAPRLKVIVNNKVQEIWKNRCEADMKQFVEANTLRDSSVLENQVFNLSGVDIFVVEFEVDIFKRRRHVNTFKTLRPLSDNLHRK